MGQSFGLIVPDENFKIFTNLPTEAIVDLWTAYNIHGDGWSLDEDSMQVIFENAQFFNAEKGFSKDVVSSLFSTLDTDKNGLIDALEMMICLGLISGMGSIDKVNFAFSAYDFEAKASIRFEEVSLLLRASIHALSKAFPSTIAFAKATYRDAEYYTKCMYESLGKGVWSELTISEFQNFCATHPVVQSWLGALANVGPNATKAVSPEPYVLDELDKASTSSWEVARAFVPLDYFKVKKAVHTVALATEVSKDDFAPLSDYEPPVGAVVGLKALLLKRSKKEAKKVEATEEGDGEAEAEEDSGPDVEDAKADEEAEAEADEAAAEDAENEASEEKEEEPVVPPVEITAEEAEALEKAAAEAEKAANPPPTPRPLPLPWFAVADLLASRGEAEEEAEPPAQPRKDPPQDILLRTWLYGFASTSSPQLRKAIAYIKSGAVIYPASSMLVSLQKDAIEDSPTNGSWQQSVYDEHIAPISALDVDGSGTIIATGERIVGALAPIAATPRIHIWDVVGNSVAVRGSISLPNSAVGVSLLDISADGKSVIALIEDGLGSVSIYDTKTFELLFTKQLGGDAVLDVKLVGSGSTFASAGSSGINFFVEDSPRFLGVRGLRSFEERPGLYGRLGQAAEGVPVTALGRFELGDELVSGTKLGQVLLWSDRTCVQLLNAHTSAVYAFHYSASSKTLVSGGKDGRVVLYKLASTAVGAIPVSGPKIKRGATVSVRSRQLEISASFDILGNNDLQSHVIRSVCLSADASKVLVGTLSGEVKELSCLTALVNAEDAGEAATVAETSEEEGAVPATASTLGKDVNGYSLVTPHVPATLPDTVIITALAKTTHGFATAGSDSTLRLWNATTETFEGALPVLPGAPYACARVIALDSAASCLAAAGPVLLAGYDVRKDSSKKGHVAVLSYPELATTETLHVASDAEIIDVRFSQEGSKFAVSTSSCETIVYGNASGSWAAIATVKTSKPSHLIDLSADGLFLRTGERTALDDADPYILKYWSISAEGANEVTTAAPLKEVQWSSPAYPLHWDLKGLWNGLAEVDEDATAALGGRGVNKPVVYKRTGASMVTTFDRANHLMVSGRTDGKLILNRVPAPAYSEEFQHGGTCGALRAHAGKVVGAVFLEEGNKLITAGALDGLIQVWKVVFDTEEPEADMAVAVEEPEPEPENEEGDEEGEGKEAPVEIPMYDSADDEDFFDGKRMKMHLPQPPSEDAPQNDFYSALKPWIANAGVPSSSLYRSCGVVPEGALEMEWVYGFSGRLTRASVKYNVEGHIVYPAGVFGVVLRKQDTGLSQVLCSAAHTDEITALDVSPSGKYVATGNRGAGDIFVYIWDALTGQVVKSLNIGRVNGVSALAFAPREDSGLLAVAGQDVVHTTFIFNWKTGVLLGTVTGDYKKTLCMSFSADASAPPSAFPRLVLGQGGAFTIIDKASSGAFRARNGLFGPDTKKSNVLAVAAVPTSASAEGAETEFLLAMSDGSIGALPRGPGRLATFLPVLVSEEGTPSGSVTAICITRPEAPVESPDEVPEYKVVIGGTNGLIKVLDKELQPIAEYDLYKKENYGLEPFGKLRGFKSICTDKTNRKILYATSAGEIGEIDLQSGIDVNLTPTGTGAPLVRSHFRDQLWGLDTHPLRQTAVTTGDDKFLRVWDLAAHNQTGAIELPDIARTVAFSPNGLLIAVGLGGKLVGKNREAGAFRDHAGKVVIVSYLQNELRVVYKTDDCKEDITCVAFSSSGSVLYAASVDKNIYLYDVLNNFLLLSVLSGHTESVRYLDVPSDDGYLVSTGFESEIIVWNVATKSPVSNEEKVLHLQGTSWTLRNSPYMPDALGVFDAYGSSKDVHKLTKSTVKNLLATGDKKGRVSLFASPAATPAAPGKLYFGHSPGGVSGVAFTYTSEHLLSVGVSDRALIQWRVTQPSPPTTDPSAEPEAKQKVSLVSLDLDAKPTSLPEIAPHATYAASGEALIWSSNSVKSIKRADLSEVTWTTLNGVIIQALTVSPCGKFALIASKETKETSHLRVFSTVTGKSLAILADDLTGDVVAVALSSDGLKAAAILGNPTHDLLLYATTDAKIDWADATLLSRMPTGSTPLSFLSFVPRPEIQLSNITDTNLMDVVTSGTEAGSTRFWRIQGRNLQPVYPTFGSNNDIPIPGVLITAFVSAPDYATAQNQYSINGDSNGKLYAWYGTYKSEYYELFSLEGAISALSFVAGGARWVAAGGRAVAFPKNYSIVQEEISVLLANANLGDYVPGAVTSLAMDASQRRLLMCFATGLVLEVATDTLTTTVIVKGAVAAE